MSENLISNFTQSISGFISRFFPAMSEQRIESQLFLFNAQKTHRTKTPRGFEQGRMDTSEGWVNYYSIGHGPAVAFVHGWGGGAYQFFSLMRGLNACGFTAVAFDHIGHQGSEAKPATLQQQIRTTDEVLHQIDQDYEDGLYAVVAHDTGCMIAANADRKLLTDLPLFLIAPVFNYRLHFLRKLQELKINPNTVKRYAAEFAASYPNEYQPLELAEKLKHFADDTLIAHDQKDSVASFAESKKFCDQHPITRLLETHDQDHLRIITSESVWQALKSHIHYDDTTVNFVQMLKDGY
jgi:pimeloyl-ACP methyl ester carboxylesterase